MNKLTKLLGVFNHDHLAQKKSVQQLRDTRVLQGLLTQVFPKNQVLVDFVATLDNDKAAHKDVAPDNLPYHTRDNAWLAKYVAQVAAQAEHQVTSDSIKRFVRRDPLFDASRYRYEQELTLGQIELMVQERVGDLTPDNCHPCLVPYKKDYDKRFRAGVVTAMTSIGLPQHSVEAGLEDYFFMWRDEIMKRTFFNNYHYQAIAPSDHADNAVLTAYRRQVLEHQDAWLRLRNYAYYQNHRDIIDELKLATPDMKLSQAKVNELAQTVAKYDQDYRTRIADKLQGVVDNDFQIR